MRCRSRTPVAVAFLGLAVLALAWAPRAAAQDWRPRAKPAAARAQGAYGGSPRLQALRGPARPLRLVRVVEVEPNDSTSQATPAALRDTVSGVINPAFDVDYFALDVPANTALDLDVDANQVGSTLDPIMALIAPDGRTVLGVNDDYDGMDSRIIYTVTTAGRYFVGITDYYGTGSLQHTYVIKLQVLVPGPGDPTTLFVSGLGYPIGLAASATGDLYTVDGDSGRILRVSPAGIVTELARQRGAMTDVVIDGAGDLLVTGYDSTYQAGVFRVSTAGERTVFTRAVSSPSAITVGPDGDVWVGDYALLRRFDPGGMLKDSVSILGTGTLSALAFSPAGELHFTTYDAIYKVVGAAAVQVASVPLYAEALAFDADGYLYVANGYLGTVTLYSPSYQAVGAVFARTNLGGPIALAFGRSASGAMTARLFASNGGYNLSPPYDGSIVEMNPAGVRALGFRVGADLLRVTPLALRAGMVGADYADTVRVQDGTGTPQFSVGNGTLPPGLRLDATTGALSGIPSDSGAYRFSIRVDRGGRLGVRSYALAVINPSVTTADAVNHLLGANVLTLALERYMDLQGNRNGRYDVGDLRAYLQVRGLVPTAALTRGATREEHRP